MFQLLLEENISVYCVIFHLSLLFACLSHPSELSVAHEEEEESIIHQFSLVLPKPQNPSTAATEHTEPAPPECPSVKESSSNSSTSITETETETDRETAARHISEGELLFSCGQMAEVRGTQHPVRDTHTP